MPALTAHRSPLIRHLGLVDYEPTFRAMQEFTTTRDAETPDEIWLLEHPPVYTLGLAGKPEHLLKESAIPLVKIDRGGQITYHGPGQLIAYLLLDLHRRKLKVREMVNLMEQALINLLGDYGIEAERHAGAPGVYVGPAKIAALGLRVKGGCSYHGLSLNVNMDLAPFGGINPCGYSGMPITQMKDFGVGDDLSAVADRLVAHLYRLLDEQMAGKGQE
ncbi:MAG: lipoyl(octanoyl) transferase LipB [Rhodocyclaceae bacterium]|nr:lipoyl(octanoyl) transferase LipB [Rhodocyclaceae bacterium]